MNSLSLFFWIVIAVVAFFGALSWLAGLYLKFDKWWHRDE